MVSRIRTWAWFSSLSDDQQHEVRELKPVLDVTTGEMEFVSNLPKSLERVPEPEPEPEVAVDPNREAVMAAKEHDRTNVVPIRAEEPTKAEGSLTDVVPDVEVPAIDAPNIDVDVDVVVAPEVTAP